MILYDVELWQGGEYRKTLAGPYECREQAEDQAEERRNFWGKRLVGEVRVSRFDAVEQCMRGKHAQGKVRLFMVRTE